MCEPTWKCIDKEHINCVEIRCDLRDRLSIYTDVWKTLKKCRFFKIHRQKNKNKKNFNKITNRTVKFTTFKETIGEYRTQLNFDSLQAL